MFLNNTLLFLLISALVLAVGYMNIVAAAPTSLCSMYNINNTNIQLPEVHGNKFYYFGFGSNMLADRIHMQNPSAVRIGVAQLLNYRLDFDFVSQRWNGAASTIVPDDNEFVFGTLWDIGVQDMKEIDDQEGVSRGIYEPKTLAVQLFLDDVRNDNSIFENRPSLEINARAYLLVKQPKTNINYYTQDNVPEHRQPSKTYLQCLIKGAKESGIPNDYVNWLRSVKHNGRIAPNMQYNLNLADVEVFQ